MTDQNFSSRGTGCTAAFLLLRLFLGLRALPASVEKSESMGTHSRATPGENIWFGESLKAGAPCDPAGTQAIAPALANRFGLPRPQQIHAAPLF